MFFFVTGNGIVDDTFCHLIDAWAVQSMARGVPDREIDDAVDALAPFRERQGDRFEDAEELARAIEAWSLVASSAELMAARPLLHDLLTLWRMVEPRQGGPGRRVGQLTPV